MIKLSNISKKYYQQSVLNNFNYLFPDNGLILLYGESGCGKTTLLNILAGITDIDNGIITSNVNTYGYITQDSHFIDYLTVIDNLKICVPFEEEQLIDFNLKKFGLWEQREQYPYTLSGGQRQRLAILQMIFSKRQVLLLDEPTAALDPENKIMVFEMISELKNDKLIVFSSHDQVALEYADDVIDFHELSTRYDEDEAEVTMHEIKRNETNQKKDERIIERKLYPFMKKYYSYPKREKKSGILLFIVLLLSFLGIGLIDIPQKKTESNVQYIYKLNQLTVVDSKNDNSLYNRLSQEDNVMEVDVIYHLSVPDGINGDTTISSDVSYNLTAKTLPFNAKVFSLSDRIAYGSYYTEAQQIILSDTRAREIGEPKDTIGKTIPLEMYDGIHQMKIVGVFYPFSKFEQEYMRASQAYEEEWEDGIFINGEFTKRYITDESFTSRGDRTYILYYKDYATMKQSYNQLVARGYTVRPIDGWVNYNITILFDAMFTVLLPLVSVMAIVAILLYFQTNRIEMNHQKFIFSIYNYLGYTFSEIRRCWLFCCLSQVIKITSVAAFIAIIIMISLNALNRIFILIPFQVFSMSPVILLCMISLLCIVTCIIAYVTVYNIKMIGYYAVLLEERDLL